ncbi:type III toxin-antitoxin system ToxN/AbiQ family toxin [Selenomonas ruminantium]|uniref:type III toxin-antitoxin system ToxN/AbiQ family toxin n=1 Tax=Selenomonas ruminantium TaxID=971 RepID=UPI00093410EF|nr:type III toxin-antitoxin system ToxN/AbiQ family toxin [Selenomonas ruminantium]
MINGVKYVLPLTSQTTNERKKRGKKKRAAVLTTFVKESNGTEIANILHNNMIPVFDSVVTPLNIDVEKDSYEINEIRYIRKNHEEIIGKASKVYEKRVNNYNDFYVKACCDFKKLEQEISGYKK